MKTYSLSIVLVCFLCISSFAQKEILTPNAAKLFETANCTLTISEKNQIAELSGFQFNEANQEMVRTTFEKEADVPVNVHVYALDLTNDGIEELGILYGPKAGSGKTGLATLLFLKDSKGVFQLNIDAPGELFFINLSNLVFPDVLVNNNRLELAVYRWDGNQYNEHKLLGRSKLKKLKLTSIYQASNRYTVTLVRE